MILHKNDNWLYFPDMSKIYSSTKPLQEHAVPVEPDLVVSFVLLAEFTLLPLTNLVEVLRHSADRSDLSRQIFCRWSIEAPDHLPIRASCGFELIPQNKFGPEHKADYVIVVGGLLPNALNANSRIRKYLLMKHAQGTPLVGVDNGSVVLAQLGLLDGKECAVHFSHRNELSQRFPNVIFTAEQPFIDLGEVITCPGGAKALDLALHLVSKHCGTARAQKAVRKMMVDPERLFNTAPHMPYQDLSVCGDWRVERAIDLMEQNITNSINVHEMSALIGTSTRDLNRAFLKFSDEGPATVFRNIRLASSHWLILNTNRTITQIAHESGFFDAAHFNRWFKNRYGAPPGEFRRRRRRLGLDRA